MSYTPQRKLKELLEGILEALQSVKVLSAVRGVLADLRVSIVNTPAVTVSSGTITNVANQTQIGGYNANQQIPALQNLIAVQSNINNILIS